MQARTLNPEVLAAQGPIVRVNRTDIERLKCQAGQNERRRMRLCAHEDTQDRLHEMLIVLRKSVYVRPHKHPNKSESFHILEGRGDVVIFDDAGKVTEAIRMGDYLSGRTFYYRLSGPLYHTVLVTSEALVFHETTNGPFRKEETVFAPWAPEETQDAACREFVDRLSDAINRFFRRI
jgi:cupin fold WbuC family metalloprotein